MEAMETLTYQSLHPETLQNLLQLCCAGQFSSEDISLSADFSGVVCSYKGMTLKSAFQAVYCTATNRTISHEALLRATDTDGNSISPTEAFAMPQAVKEARFFDLLVRTIHILNFAAQTNRQHLLFLNINAKYILDAHENILEKVFAHILGLFGIRPPSVVLEILEDDVDDLDGLSEAVKRFQNSGYHIAIDDFGSRSSNFDRLWRIAPDIVKIDRSLILQATDSGKARKVLLKIVEVLHELNAKVVIEGIETEEQHLIATNSGADYVQGFYYSRPSPTMK